VNCWVFPATTEGFAGATAIETSVAVVTVSVVVPEMLPEVALIVVVPAFSGDTRPPALTVPVVMLDEAQVTLLVRFCVLLSE
jgi:hypothetical protein